MESVPLDRGGAWQQNERVMVRYPTAVAAPIDSLRVDALRVDALRASLLGGAVVVVGLIISLLLVTQT